MKPIPLLKCRDMTEAIAFYTTILHFRLTCPAASANDRVVALIDGEAELQLTTLEADTLLGSVINVRVEDVNQLFQTYPDRGLVITGKEGSPVHQGPVNQSWGMREFYVTDPSGNTMRFGKPIE